MCSACHHVIKRTNAAMANDENMNLKANNYLALETPYKAAKPRFITSSRFSVTRSALTSSRRRSRTLLRAKKSVPITDVFLLRPGKEMAFDNPENPTIIEDFIKALGATPVVYPYRNECCGGYVTMEDEALPRKKVAQINESAKGAGAEMLITACPLCMYNLNHNSENGLPVKYFTEILAEALGVKEGTEMNKQLSEEITRIAGVNPRKCSEMRQVFGHMSRI